MRDLHVHYYAQKSLWMDSTKWYQKTRIMNFVKHKQLTS